MMCQMHANGWERDETAEHPTFKRTHHTAQNWNATAGVLGAREIMVQVIILQFDCRRSRFPSAVGASKLLIALHNFTDCRMTRTYMEGGHLHVVCLCQHYAPHGAGPAGAHLEQ